MTDELVWTEERIEHIARHGVTPAQIKAVCAGHSLVHRVRASTRPASPCVGRESSLKCSWTHLCGVIHLLRRHPNSGPRRPSRHRLSRVELQVLAPKLLPLDVDTGLV